MTGPEIERLAPDDDGGDARDDEGEGRKIVFWLLIGFLLLVIVPPGLGESPYNFF